MKAVGKLFEDPKRAEAIASAIGSLQRAKAAIDEAQRKAMQAAGLVTRDDFKAAGKRLSHLKRRGKEPAPGLHTPPPRPPTPYAAARARRSATTWPPRWWARER